MARAPQRVTLASTGIDAALVAAKLVLGVLTGSLALVSAADYFRRFAREVFRTGPTPAG